jgi:hypothetical protein
MSDTFTYRGKELPFFDHEYNTTILNERAVEIPIAMWWLDQHAGDGVGIEIGNVLSHYFPDVLSDRIIVDAYEEAEGVDNLDVFQVRGGFDYIFAISTLEHVRWDEPEPRSLMGAWHAMEHLRDQLNPGGKMLITVPFGSNPGLDYAILSGQSGAAEQTVIMRTGGLWAETTATGRWERRGGTWHEADSVWWERYGKSTPWAETVWVGEFEK